MESVVLTAIANNGELVENFLSPDQGFSFYDAYSNIPIKEFEGEEFQYLRI